MDISTRQLKAFMELANCLNFTRAALNLHIAQPALSQQIAELEKELGVRLFNRTSRSVSLTPAGVIMYENAQSILSSVNELHMRLQRAESGEIGKIKIGFLNEPFKAILSKIIKHFSVSFPDIEIEIHQYNIGQLHRLLEAGDIDIALNLCYPEDRCPDDGYSSVLLGTEELCIAISKEHPFFSSGCPNFSLLSNNTLLIPDDEAAPGFSQVILNTCLENHIGPRAQSYAGTVEAILLKVDAEMGFSILPDLTGYTTSNVAFIPVGGCALQSMAVWKTGNRNASLSLFVDAIYAFAGGQ